MPVIWEIMVYSRRIQLPKYFILDIQYNLDEATRNKGDIHAHEKMKIYYCRPRKKNLKET